MGRENMTIKDEIALDNLMYYGFNNPYEKDGEEEVKPNACSECKEIMEWQHAQPTASLPETYYLECPVCGHQSGHC